jgi:glycosyltransferase involved in cell wall biosynthesis
MSKKLRISFIIPLVMSGGVFVILEYYRQLTALGHEVNIYYPLFQHCEFSKSTPLWKRFMIRLRLFSRNLINFTRAIPLFSEKIPVKPVVVINNMFIPNADIVVATAWFTAYDVHKLSARKGRKFYFVQSYEIWGGEASKVDNSYRLPLGIITIAPLLTDLMKTKFKRDDITEIHNGIRFDKFYPPPAKDFDRASVLLMAHNMRLKGTRDAIDALTIVKERYPQLKITVFGMYDKPIAPFDFEYRQNPPYETLLSLYQNATVFIFPSHNEDGWGLTPIEAMACKCAVVATNAGCIPVINNGKNLILAEAQNPTSIADAVIKLLENKELTETVASEGLARVQKLDWSKSALALSDILTA